IEDLNAEIKENIEKQKQLELEWKEQIGIIKKLHEREHDREVAELVIQHEDEMKELHAKLMKEQQLLLDELHHQMEAAHEEEMHQAEALHNLKVEALRLSSNNVHTSQLELMQNNLRKEKETALVELREMLNDKHAQEIAVLQSRCQFELEHIKEQQLKEKEEMTLKHQSDLDEERGKVILEMEEKHAKKLESLKKEWALNVEISCKNVSEELSEKHQAELNEMKRTLKSELEMKGTLKSELEQVKGKLESLSLEKEQVEMECKNLENQYQLAMTKLQTDHAQELQDVKEQYKKHEDELQQEIEECHAVLEKRKAESQEEIKQLWYQLDSARASRQELSELKEQLLARTSHMEEMENLKKDFQTKWDKKRGEHENELEQLRLYFEEKLKVLEGNYREELTMLHQKLQEGKDDTLLEIENDQEEHMDMGPCVTLLEEMTEKERRDLFEQLTVQLEHHKEELSCLQLHLDKKHKEMTKVRLQSAQDAARQIETEVKERLVALENEYKVKFDILEAERKSVSTQQEEIENLRREHSKLKEMRLQEELLLKDKLEQIKCKLMEDHVNELRRAREEVREIEEVHKAKSEEWKLKWEDLNKKTEEKLLVYEERENKAEREKQALQKQFELHEAEMTCLQEQQAARITQLEKSLTEQQNHVQQLEDNLAKTQNTLVQHDSELNATKALMATELEKAKHVFQEECTAKLEDAQNRFMEDLKAMTKKLAEEHEILLQELREKHVGELVSQRKDLEHKHKEQILSLTADLRAQHQAEIETLKSTLEREHQIRLETSLANLQKNYQTQMTELEDKHLSNLDTLESTYLSEIQFLRDEHRQAVESLQVDLQEQLLKQGKTNQEFLAQNLARMKHKHDEELQICQENLKIELATAHIEELKVMAAELEAAHKEDLSAELEKQRCLLEHDYHKSLDLLRGEILHMEEQHKKAMQELQGLHIAEIEKEKERWQQLQREKEQQNSDKQQLQAKITSLNKEMEEANAELKNLQQQDRENQEGEALIALMRSDIELYKNERKKLQECNQQALRLLLIMVKATKDIEGLICKKTGLCLDDSLASGDSRENQSTIAEMVLSQTMMEKGEMKECERVHQGQDLEETLPEHSFESLLPDEMSELSEHLCESIFDNPDLVFENEERIQKICHSVHVAVEKLIELLAESTKQSEEEYNRRNWEACQVANEHHELMECLNEESAAKNQLALELHKAKGLSEGCLAERDALEAALRLKEESEHRLVVELESVKTQFQDLTEEHTKCLEEQKLIRSQNKALSANLGEREIDLLKEVERLSKAKLELQCQAEKDCSTLNAQLKILEMELEEQLNKNQRMATLSLEVVDLKQQIQALERQLKSQRDFMDKQAVEREHERDEFQEEIQKLEMQLKQTEKNQASGQSRVLVESLYEEIKERTDDYNNICLEREQMQKEITIRNEEIEKLAARVRELECLNMEEAKHVSQLTQEVQKMKKMETEWKQDKEALQQQRYNNLIQISTLQSRLDEIRHRVLPEGEMDHILQGELKAQEELLTKKTEVANLLERLKQFEEDLINKNDEIMHLSLKFEVERRDYVSKIMQLQEENAYLKENTEKHNKSQSPGDSDLALLQFLKSLLEEKNQETDHLNKQIAELEHELESCKEDKVLEKQMFETEDLKSVIEQLRAAQEQLARDKSEEIEQLHGVIETLQKELALRGPICDETDDSQDHSNTLVLEEQEDTLQNELQSGLSNHLENRDGDTSCLLLQSNQQQLHDQLEVVLADREALQRLLEEKESHLNVVVKNLEQNLKNVQESSRQYFKELSDLQLQYKELQEDYKDMEVCLTQRNSEIAVASSCIQELEGKLRDKEVAFSERELELQATSKQKAEQAAEVLREKENVVQLENELKVLVATLHDKEVAYQSEINELKAAAVELRSQNEKSMEELEALRSERALFHLQLKWSFEEDQNDDQKATELYKSVPDQDGVQLSLETGEGREEQELSDKPSATKNSDKLEKEVLITDQKTSSKNLNTQGTSSDLVLQCNNENAETTVHQDGNVTQCLGIVPGATEPGIQGKELFSHQLKNMLKIVDEESCKILVLSEKILPVKEEKNVQQAPLMEGLRKESRTLLDAVQSLKHYLSTMPDKEGKEYSSAFFDWRGELLQAVQCVLEKERNMLQSYFQSHFCNSGSGDEGSLVEKLEHIAEQQERQQKVVLEHLLSSDRNSLLTEIQDLQAQLRLMHLQNQEKLQQLQETLINAENHGSKQEHQLRRQVELLEYKLQQEKSLASDLQTSLKSEQEKASEMHKLLKQEDIAVMNLKLDLSESKKTNAKLQKAFQDLQKEVIKYNSALESKEKSMTSVLQDLQNARLKEKELQAMIDEQHQQLKIKEDEKSKAIEELQAALELQRIQTNRLSVALEHKQAANSNLHKELQIEHSRCEALLSQEQNKSLELQKNIDSEKSRCLELLSALNHERVLTEQLSRRVNECGSCKHKDSLQELQAQLTIERSHARELAAIIEKTQQQALDSKKQMDRKQICEEPEREQDLFSSLQITQASLQNQKQDIIRALEIEREKEGQIKREWEQLQSILRFLRDQENTVERGARDTKPEQQMALDKLKDLQRAQESQVKKQVTSFWFVTSA
ncbi:UNVERIFIED_CONTAM: hypothetical protein K2H54_042482, partial [Gekko kuhli]